MTGGEHFNEVFFNEARIPDAHRLGPEGGGWAVAKTTLMHERMAIGGIELMSFRWEDFVAHANAHRERIDGVLRDEIGRLYTSVKTLELLNARMITKLGRGEMPAAEASVMKLAMARIVSQGGEVGLRLLGPDAVQKDGTWQDVFLMAPSFHIAGGTDEIQKNQAAERVLGLPREVQPDRDVPFDQIARS
jgi:alkylation response protein AidB-like acyl-CoA dehydrogenase